MQKIIYVLLLVSFFGCKKIDKLTQFNMAYDESIVIKSSTGINLPFNVLTPDVETNSESTFELNDTRKDLIEEIRLKKLTLSISSPANADFSFLKSISIFISAEGQKEEKIAWLLDVPADAQTIDLILTGIDLKEYLKAPKIALRLNTETDELLTSDYTIDIHSVFYVDAKILGQ